MSKSRCRRCGEERSVFKRTGYCVFCTADIDSEKDLSRASETQVGGGHYKDYAIQPGEFCHKNRLPYCESNAIKYLCRHRSKNGLEDLEKAKHYIELLIEWEYADEN